MSVNLNAPFDAVCVVVPCNAGVYVAPENDPEMLIVAVDELSDPTIWLNSSISAI